MVKGVIRYFEDSSRKKRFTRIYETVRAHTMVPEQEFMDNLFLAEQYGKEKGAVAECGVWKGGMTAAMAMLLGNERDYFLFDSFEGLPPAKDIDGEKAKAWQADKSSPFYFDNCKANEKEAIEAMKLSGAKNFKTIPGFFSDTLPHFKTKEPLRILRLDGDWYDSTMDCLKFLYPLVAENGLILIDDYYLWDGCRRAVHDYFSKENISARIRQFNNGNVHFILKEK
ncbi:MAG: class I SAM-dependent methyltransferase [Bacteroidetes bacterium]|nr:class I SAM-dependent methyltransferase [Bacteroidota bacterium]